MQITALAPVSPATRDDPGSPREGSTVDFQSFLRLLTAQLRNQDPLSPLDSTQFVAQLASFSTVEQLVAANDKLDALSGSLSGGGIGDFASWIGRTAEVEGAPALFDGAPVAVSVRPVAGASRAELVVRSTDGTEIDRSPLLLDGGQVYWDGAGGVTGTSYQFEAVHYMSDGASVANPAATFSPINAVRNEDDTVLISLASGVFVTPDRVLSLGR